MSEIRLRPMSHWLAQVARTTSTPRREPAQILEVGRRCARVRVTSTHEAMVTATTCAAG